MLSLPEEWDYTLAGLLFINREKIDAVREAIKELESAGYIIRTHERDEKGRLKGTEYVIYEQPQKENPEVEKPTSENPMQLNTYKRNKDTEYVIFAMERSKPAIRNIRAYLLTALYNAPATKAGHFLFMWLLIRPA